MPTRRRSIATRPRRKRVWARASSSLVIPAGGSDQFNLTDQYNFQAGVTANQPGMTVGRIRLSCAFGLTSTPGAGDSIFIGVIIRHIGSTDALSPLTDLHADWMFWTKRFPNDEATGPGDGSAAWDFDVKAQRRMEELGQSVFLVCEASPLVAGELFFGASTLLVLP